jgi:asparagine synthase (glutamine-hydrolysing)
MDLPLSTASTHGSSPRRPQAGVKVALSGLGADECFGGYPSFVDVPRSVRIFRSFDFVPSLGWLSRQAISLMMACGLDLHPKAAGLAQYGGSWEGAYLLRRSVYMPWELGDLLDPGVLQAGLRRLRPLHRLAAELRKAGDLDDFDQVSSWRPRSTCVTIPA